MENFLFISTTLATSDELPLICIFIILIFVHLQEFVS